MATYSVKKQFTSWDEVFVEADSEDQAIDIATENWLDLEPEGVDDYHFTGNFAVEELK